MRFIDPNGDSVWIYYEPLGSETYSRDDVPWYNKIIGFVSRSTHSVVRIKTKNEDKTFEFGGKGNLLKRDTDMGRLSKFASSVVSEPPVFLKEGESENFDFENKMLNKANAIFDNQDLLPSYDPVDANCNGFANALIQIVGGTISDWNRSAYFFGNIQEFVKSFFK